MDLFAKMQMYGLNSYVYAPKDDHKHRADWKVLYNTMEAREIMDLIHACK